MGYITILLKIAPLIATLFLAIYSRKFKILPDKPVEVLSKLTFGIVAPFVIFGVITKIVIKPTDLFMPLIAVAVCLLLYAVMFGYTKLRGIKNSLSGAFVITFCGFAITSFVYPFAAQLVDAQTFAQIGLVDAFLFPLTIIVILPLTDILYKSKEQKGIGQNLKKVFGNPIFIAALIGIIFQLLQIRPSAELTNGLDFITRGFGFLALFTIGLRLKLPNFKSIKKAFLFVGLRIIIATICVVLISYVFKIERQSMVGLILVFTSPIAPFSFIMSDQNGFDTTQITDYFTISVGISILLCTLVFLFF